MHMKAREHWIALGIWDHLNFFVLSHGAPHVGVEKNVAIIFKKKNLHICVSQFQVS